VGELTVDTTKDTVVVHDGSTAGGFPLAKESQATTNVAVTGGTINNTSIGASTASTGAFTTLTSSSDATLHGLTVGRGAGAVSSNTAVGASALAANTTGSVNTAVGYQAGFSNTTGAGGAFFGRLAGYGNTTGNGNTALGNVALYINSTGSNNSALGESALGSNTVGGNNTALGLQALYSNTTASNNTAVGYQAGFTNTTGVNNVLIGGEAGYSTTALAGTFLGYQAGYAATSGTYNTFLGHQSGASITTGAKNTILGPYNGNQGGLDIRTASNYIVLSDGDGNPVVYGTSTDGTITLGTTGNFCNAAYNKGTGSQLYTDFRVGWTSAASPGTQTGYISTNGTTTSYVTTSDYRLKNSATPMIGALAKVALLKPCTYKWNADGSDGEGFIAHELAEVCPSAVTGSKDAVDAEGKPQYQGIDTSFLVATLTAAIQELKAEFDAYKATHP
jgi:hypothetical protein